MTKKYPTYRIVAWVYLAILALGPLAGLFWQTHWGWIRASWILYPVMVLALLAAIRSSRKDPRSFLLGLAATLFYAAFFVWHGGDWESIIRIVVALLPLFFIAPIRENISADMFRKFWVLYLVILLVPIFISVLQLLGYFPYYDSGMAYDFYPGRISGGYLKPNNLSAILFPAYLFGFYLFYSGNKKSGATLAGSAFLIVLIGGLSTSVIAYGIIFLLAFVPRFSNAVIYRGFRYCIFIVIGISSFFALSLGRETIGLTEGLRKKLPMWMVNSEYFFHSKPVEILLGKGVVQLSLEAKKYGIASLSEVHNNDFRIMITFGILGYVLYGLLLRDVATRINKSSNSEQLKFLHSACLIHVLLYAVTNEPAFYAGIFWPLTAWIFFTVDPRIKATKK